MGCSRSSIEALGVVMALLCWYGASTAVADEQGPESKVVDPDFPRIVESTNSDPDPVAAVAGPDASITAATTVYQTVPAPCWASYDSCTGHYFLVLGHGYGICSTGRSASADAYFDDADCGWAGYAGSIAGPQELWLVVPNAWVLDQTSADGGRVYVSISRVYEYLGGDCSGTALRSFTGDTATCDTSVGGEEWLHAYGDSAADCDSSQTGDPIPCHRLDLYVSSPTGIGLYSSGTHFAPTSVMETVRIALRPLTLAVSRFGGIDRPFICGGQR